MPGLGTCSQTETRLYSQGARGLVEARNEHRILELLQAGAGALIFEGDS